MFFSVSFTRTQRKPKRMAFSFFGIDISESSIFNFCFFFLMVFCLIAVQSQAHTVRPFERDLDGIRWKLAHPSNKIFFFFFFLSLFFGLMMSWQLQMQAFQSTEHVANILRMNDCTHQRRKKRETRWSSFRYSKINQKRLCASVCVSVYNSGQPTVCWRVL